MPSAEIITIGTEILLGEIVDTNTRYIARTLRSMGIPARLVLVGGLDPHNPAGISRDRLETWTSEGAVEWWGMRTDMPNVLSQATIVCLPSYREGMPKSLLEACAAGHACELPVR